MLEFIAKVRPQIPIVMSFAVPDRPREVRMEAAYFLQQLCQSRYKHFAVFLAYSDQFESQSKCLSFMQLLDIANVYCLSWYTNSSGLSGG